MEHKMEHKVAHKMARKMACKVACKVARKIVHKVVSYEIVTIFMQFLTMVLLSFKKSLNGKGLRGLKST